MSVRADNKQSTPKIALPSEAQDEIRRSRKKSQKAHSGHDKYQTEGFMSGLRQDHLNKRGLAMLDLLESQMCSASLKASRTLNHIMTAYVDSFTGQDIDVWHKDRHQAAVSKALQGISGPVAAYANRQLNNVFFATRTMK